MKNKNFLIEQYEDMIFTILMDEMAAEDGKRALNKLEKLENNSDKDLTRFDSKCIQMINQYFVKYKLVLLNQSIFKWMIRCTATIGIAILCFGIAFAVSPTLQAGTLNFISEHFDKGSDYRFWGEAAVEDKQSPLPSIELEYLPDDYELTSESSDRMGVYCQYSSTQMSGTIDVSLYHNAPDLLRLDTENAIIKSIMIRNATAEISIKGDDIQLVWIDTETNYIIHIFAHEEDEKEIIKIAENLHIY